MILPKRKNHRLHNFDYGSSGYYFVTICTYNKELLLSSIHNSDEETSGIINKDIYKKTVVIPSKLGAKVEECWYNTERLNKNITITDFVMMPNHIHSIISVKNEGVLSDFQKNHRFEITENKNHRSIQGIIKDFKSVTTRYYKKEFNVDHSLWQDSFYDTVIRDAEQLHSIRQYIYENPYKWGYDSLFRSE